ncbi:MAG: NUDIX domain-containing protein [Pseudonocardiaceae bacterium]
MSQVFRRWHCESPFSVQHPRSSSAMGRVGKKSVIETWTLPATHCTIAKIQRVQRGLQDLTRRPLLASPHFSFIRLRDQTGRIFLANPTYKEYWDLPGRMAEANEPPRVAAEREVAEELGFQAKISHLISVDWIGPHGPWDDYLIFMFDGGTLVDAAIKRLIITDSEISEFGFFSVRDTSRLLRKDAARRLAHAVDSLENSRHVHYMEHQILHIQKTSD